MDPGIVSVIGEVADAARFVAGLPLHLRRPLAPEQARALIRDRLERRTENFLRIARRAIYGYPSSPYFQLLRMAGCEYGDLQRLIEREGLDVALTELFRRGVYLTVEEFKGRRPAIRGSSTISAGPDRLRNPLIRGQLPMRSSGSRGQASPARVSLAAIRDEAISRSAAVAARGGTAWLPAVWGVPGSAAISVLLQIVFGTALPVQWFSQVAVDAESIHPRYRWSARLLRWSGLLAGRSLPAPAHVPLNQPMPIVRWMMETLRAGLVPHLNTFASSGVAVCRAAAEAGVDLSGAQMTVSGEPVTERRLAFIKSSGIAVSPCYGSMPIGLIGLGCERPLAADDQHLFDELRCVVQPGPEGAGVGLPAETLLYTSLSGANPFIIFNASMGDRARLLRRRCDCPLEQVGWSTHLEAVRSFEKLTMGGMTFLDRDIVEVLEVTLPKRFGGGPTDYQLVEQQGPSGQADLRLLVDPSLGPLDGAAITNAFLEAIGMGSGAEHLMALQWRQLGLPRVERSRPVATGSGKIQHLHQEGTLAGAR